MGTMGMQSCSFGMPSLDLLVKSPGWGNGGIQQYPSPTTKKKKKGLNFDYTGISVLPLVQSKSASKGKKQLDLNKIISYQRSSPVSEVK